METNTQNQQENQQKPIKTEKSKNDEQLDSLQGNLQDCFKKFKKERFEKMKHNKYLKQQKQNERRTQEFKDQLRIKFVEQAKKYFGVPYHKRYLTPEDENYNSPLFLDCCGLIRQVIYDLREDFGFTLGRWNQSYQFDILPIDLKKEEMKPGDLVFISATYYNEKLKPFPHRMTHVEIFTGGETGEQTIGARWQRGVVEYHDSYKFVSKTYHDMTFHFKSLDTWLEGICKSHCEEHPWRDDRDLWVPDKYSVFAAEAEADCADPEEENENEQTQTIKQVFVGKGNNDKLIREYFENKPQEYSILPQSQSFSKNFYFKWVQCLQDLDFFSFKESRQIINHIPNVLQVVGNKSALINTLEEFHKENEQLKYTKNEFFPETYQLDNMADEIAFLNSKTEGIWILKPKNLNMGRGIQIISDIKTFRKEFVESKKFYLGEFVTNYMIDHKKKDKSEKEAVNEVLEKKHGNESEQSQKLEQSEQEQEKEMKYKNLSTQSIIQKYIENPLLLNGKKFDIRCYGLIAKTKPYLLLFHHGYLRLCISDYGMENIENIDESKYAHLTNAAIQRTHKQYNQEKQNLIWSMQQFEEYLKDKKAADNERIEQLYQEMKSICCYVMQASMKKLEKKVGQYELFGIDIILDDNLKPYLLEVNSNPALFTNTQILKDVIPKMMHSTMDIVFKVNENQDNKKEEQQQQEKEKEQLPLGEWEIVYDEHKNKGILN